MAFLLLLAVWFSGTAALAAEVVWFRGLGRGVGTSAEALAVVSAAFLGGLGIGAAISSRRAPTAAFPLRSAFRCELFAGVLVFLSPFGIALVPGAHLALLEGLGLAPGRSAWPAALVALPILVLPTAFLGATLPFLVRSLVTSGVARAGRWTGLLYGVNTLGAVAGTGLAVVWLLPAFGEIASLRIAGGLNLVAAALILLADGVSSRRGAVAEPAAAPVADPPSSSPPAPPDVRATAAPAPLPAPLPALPAPARAVPIPELALFASGLFALGAEVAWFRLLEPLTGIHLYGFALLLGAVLAGTALGGAIGGVVADRVRRPDLALTNVLAIAGALVIGSIWLSGAVPYLGLHAATVAVDAARAAKESSEVVRQTGYDTLAAAKLWASALCVAPALVAFSMAYPLAVKARALDAGRAAAAAGSTYAWNTAGNMLGSLFAGFVLLPAIGGPRTLAVLGGLALATAAALRLLAARPRGVIPALAPLAGLALLALPGSGPRIDAAGPSLPEIVCLERWTDSYAIRSRDDLAAFATSMGGVYPRPAGREDLDPIKPIEGVVSNVGLLLERTVVRLRQGGLSESKIVPSSPDSGSETEVALALVPYLAHPDPKRALCIGHGAGWSAETLLATPMDVDVAELEPAVLDRVEAYRGPLLVRSAKNSHLHETDGRLLLRLAAARPESERYDVIVSQPSHPWVPGAGHLFTREAYALARSALSRGGVFSQWLNVFSMTRELLHSALEAWHEVFPDCWVLQYYDELVLVGFTSPPTIDVARWSKALADGRVAVRAHEAGIEEPADLVHRIALDGEGLARMLPAGTPPATDDDPRLELGLAWVRFGTPDWTKAEAEKKAIYADLKAAFPPNFERLVPDRIARDGLVAATVWRLFATEQTDEARRWLRSSNPVLAFEGGALGRRARAKDALLSAAAAGLGTDEKIALGTRAIELLRAAIKLAPADPEPVVELGEALLARDRAEDAVQEMDAASARHGDDGRVLALLGRAHALTGRLAEAEAAFRRALAARSPRAPNGTGFALARSILGAEPRRPVEARDALRSDPGTFSDEEALSQLRELEVEVGEPGPNGLSPGAEEADTAIAELHKRRGRGQLEAAINALGTANPNEDAAKAATDYLPESALAWRTRGRYELRGSRPEAAAVSFRKAISLAADPAAERALIATWYRIARRDPAELDREKKP